MTVVSASKIDSNKYYVVFEPPYAGASFIEGVIEMPDEDFELFCACTFNSKEEAWEYAYNRLFLYE